MEHCYFICGKSVPVSVSLLLLALLIFVGYKAHDRDDRGAPFYRSLLILCAGIGFGMTAGSFASPVESSEGATFKIVAGLMVTFATGFLLKYFQEELLARLKDAAKGGLATARFFMFLAAFIGGGLSTYVYRTYYGEVPNEIKLIKKATDDLAGIKKQLEALDKKEKPETDQPKK
jgi:ABC-type transport system involved in cytochrome c biogenesis permease subunit